MLDVLPEVPHVAEPVLGVEDQFLLDQEILVEVTIPSHDGVHSGDLFGEAGDRELNPVFDPPSSPIVSFTQTNWVPGSRGK